MKTHEHEIGQCEYCEASVPKILLGHIGPVAVCYPCYAAAVERLGLVDRFFEGKTKRQVARLRAAVPKFPEHFDAGHTESPEWPNDFTAFCCRKASWYGFKDAFAFFGECLK